MGDQPTPRRAKNCVLTPGVFDPLGDQISHPARVWVGGALIAVLGVMTITIALAAVVLRNNCVVLGESDLKHRHCPLAMDTWLNLIRMEHHLALGLI